MFTEGERRVVVCMCFQGWGIEWGKCECVRDNRVLPFSSFSSSALLCSNEQRAWDRSENLRTCFHLVGSKYKSFFLQVSVMMWDREPRRARFLNASPRSTVKLTPGLSAGHAWLSKVFLGTQNWDCENSRPASTSSLDLGGWETPKSGFRVSVCNA